MTTRLAVPSSSKITPAKLAKMLDRLRMHGWERAAFLIEHAFFQLNQTERVTAEVDDDHLRVYLDDGWQLAWYLDTDQPEVHVGQRPKWYTLDEWLRTTHNLTDDEEAETVASEITDAMANLAGFLYSAQIGAINALSAKSRP